jgi:hypothetical protein
LLLPLLFARLLETGEAVVVRVVDGIEGRCGPPELLTLTGLLLAITDGAEGFVTGCD